MITKQSWIQLHLLIKRFSILNRESFDILKLRFERINVHHLQLRNARPSRERFVFLSKTAQNVGYLLFEPPAENSTAAAKYEEADGDQGCPGPSWSPAPSPPSPPPVPQELKSGAHVRIQPAY